jgi:hypothetical protein
MTLANAKDFYKHAYSAVVSYTIDMFWSKTKFRERAHPNDMRCNAAEFPQLHNLAEFIHVPYHRKCMFQCGPEIPHR